MNADPYALLAFGTVLWATPFFFARTKGQVPVRIATGIVISPPKLMLVSIAVFSAGTFIRMRIEDHLLEARFGPGSCRLSS
jgi:hypothetical protein